MDGPSQVCARAAVEALERAIASGPQASHEEIAAAFRRIVTLRDHVLAARRKGLASDDCADRVNSVTSLAFGGEFPLSGFHVHRLQMTRDELQRLLAEHAGAGG